MAFYRAVVDFRNAIERMRLKRGTLQDTEHIFWGFGVPPRRYPEQGSDDDGLAGSRIPRRPTPDAGGAVASVASVTSGVARAPGLWAGGSVVPAPTGRRGIWYPIPLFPDPTVVA
jgi:hypothetical protein